MLTALDWLRRCHTGNDLLATLKMLAEDLPPAQEEDNLGHPYSALSGPCRRCWVYPRKSENGFCGFCTSIIQSKSGLKAVVHDSVVIWGYVSHFPWEVTPGDPPLGNLLSYCAIDNQHFLLMMDRLLLKSWLQDLVLTYGMNLLGLMQIFPTMGQGKSIGMGDILTRAVHQESLVAHDQLWVRFFSSAHQLTSPHLRDQKGMLTFPVTDFIGLLEMGAVFRSVLRPEEQQDLYTLLTHADKEEQSFYWGRFSRRITRRARDMIDAWNVRQWPLTRIQMLYELLDYVAPAPHS
ncbi:MAG: hypothetical protein HQL78_11805 [Magnetococcales bacterium]|nr:hypothetical protein [Magnetococcales bacterium]